jgi:signal transduction histidine kinase
MAANIQKDEMVRFVSHEIRSPLAGVSSLIELLNEPEIAANTTEVLRYASLIRNSTGNVMKLANDILDLAKLESGAINLHKKPVPLGPFLEEMVAGFEPLSLAKEINLAVEVVEPLTLEVDESKLSSVVGNLISNAIKFTPKGGSVTIWLRKAERASLPVCEIEVADTGMGIREEQLPILFEKFGSKQRLGTDGERGTGLGLSIVKELVTLHGGEVFAVSVVDKGSQFFIHLPL